MSAQPAVLREPTILDHGETAFRSIWRSGFHESEICFIRRPRINGIRGQTSIGICWIHPSTLTNS